MKAAYDAQAAAAVAQKTMSEAEIAAAKLKYGSVTGQSTTGGGATSMGTTNGGEPESILLLTRSTDAGASEVLQRIKPVLSKINPDRTLLLLTASAKLTVADAILYDMKLSNLRTALAVAQDQYQRAVKNDPGDKPKVDDTNERMAGLTSAGALVDSFSKLGSYFQTDYAFGPTTAA